jgi:prefoldin subunit 5
MAQTIFEQMKVSLEESLATNKFLIAAVEKLKKEIPDLGPTLNNLSEGIKSLEAFGRIASQVQNRLDGIQAGITSINNMAVAMENLKGEIQLISKQLFIL